MRLLADDLASLDAPPLRRTLRRARRSRSLPWFRMGLLSAAMVAGLAYLAGQRPNPSDEPARIPLAPLLAPPPIWQAVARPVPLYAVDGIDPASFDLEVRRHADGGREDTLTFGTFGEAGYAHLRARRGVSDPEPSSFFVDLARQAAQAGLSVARSAQAAPLSTKFGLAEIATVTMAGTTEESCLALRIDRPPAQFSLRGWVCGSAAQPASEAQVACLLDRLALVGEDPVLETLFAQAERQRTAGCAPVQPRPAPVGSHDVSAHEAEPNVMARIAPSVRPVRPTRLRRL